MRSKVIFSDYEKIIYTKEGIFVYDIETGELIGVY